MYLINSPYFCGQKQFLATGDIIVHISADKLGSIPIPLPPLAEQRRICDFLNGVCYVQDGDVRRITATMVLYVPDCVEINEVKSVAPDAAPVKF